MFFTNLALFGLPDIEFMCERWKIYLPFNVFIGQFICCWCLQGLLSHTYIPASDYR